MNLWPTVLGLIQGSLLIIVAPALVGLIRWLKARLQLRQGPPLWQPYVDLIKLMRRPAVRPSTTSSIFALTPKVLFITYGSLAFMVPVFTTQTLLTVDLLVMIYVLGLARFFLCLAGLDSGTGFGGMGAGREMFFAFLTEISLILFAAALMIEWQTTTLGGEGGLLARQGEFDTFLDRPELMLLGIALALLVLLECGRLPVDNPTGHLELMMAQRALVLEYAGRDLALIELAEMIKLLMLLALLGGLFVPLPWAVLTIKGPIALAIISAAVKLGLLALILALWELICPRLPLRSVGSFSLVGMALSLIATILHTVFSPG